MIKFAFEPGYIDRIENGLFHNKFQFWTGAFNRILNFRENGDYHSIAVPVPCTRPTYRMIR
jgi:hypothetical protein